MNIKTTAVMVLVLGLLLIGVFFIRNQEANKPAEPVADSQPLSTSLINKPLFDPPLEDVVKVVCSRPGQPDWVFEKVEDGADSGAAWRMTAPMAFDVPDWRANQIVNRLKDLKYQFVYGAGQEGVVDAEKAGLTTPKATIDLHEKSGLQHKVRIGLAASDTTHYVGAGDSKDVFVVQGSLSNLLARHAFEYRDLKMFDFDASTAVSVEFNVLEDENDDKHTTYRLIKSGGDWRFEEPFSDDAIDKPVMDAIASMSKLRASKWAASDTAAVMARYGFAPPKVDIEVTCEEVVTRDPVESQEGDGESTEPMTETVLRQYRLLIATRGPLGEDNMVYAKLDTDGTVATITKSIMDKMTPEMNTWRDMTLLETDVADVERITIKSREGGSGTLVRNDLGAWIFEGSGELADKPTVRELIETITKLDAFTYVHHANPRNPEFGLVEPAVQIEMTLAGEDEPAVIKMGKPTDPVGKRAYYLQKSGSKAVAKIRSRQAEVLLQSPISYRDRDVLKLAISEISEIRLERLSDRTGQFDRHVLVNDAGKWRLTEPFDGNTDLQAAATLAAKLADLRAVTMVPDSDVNAQTAIKHPYAIVSITHAKPAVISADGDSPSTSATGTGTVSMSIGHRDGKVYVKRADRDALYEVPESVLEAVRADVHSKSFWSFEMSQVTSVTVTSGDTSHGFNRGPEGWYYAQEPALPIDGKKVDNLVLQLGDLKLQKFVAYNVESMGTYGLDNPAQSVTISTDEGRTLELMISRKERAANEEGSVFAAVKGWPHVFLLTPATVSRVSVDMDEFEGNGGS